MKNIFKFFGTILTVVFAAFCMTGCLAEDDLGTADLGLHVKVFFPTKVVAGQPMTINGSGFSDATEIVFPGEIVVTDFQIVSNDMIRVNAPKGIAAEGGKIIVRTAEEQVESPLPLTLGETKISGYSANAGDQVDGGSQITIFGTDLEFITGVELLDADGNPALITDKLFNKKATASIIFTVPKKVYEGTFVGKVYTVDGKTFEMPELTYRQASDGGYWESVRTTIWKNDGSIGDGTWSDNTYRFALTGTNGGDASVELPADLWEKLKSTPFKVQFKVTSEEWWQIRVLSGWWNVQWPEKNLSDARAEYDFKPGSELVVDNGDGTFYFEVNFEGHPILDKLDQENLLFAGSGFQILELYTEEKVWVSDGPVTQEVEQVIFEGEEVVYSDWSVSQSFAGSYFKDVVEGATITVFIKDKTGDYNAIFKHQDWSDWTDLQDVKVDTDESFSAVVPSSAIDELKTDGLRLQGIGFTVVKVTLKTTVTIGGGDDSEETGNVIWENDGSYGDVTCEATKYRFAEEGKDTQNECAGTFTADIWGKIKTGPFEILLEKSEDVDSWNVRMMDGWWSVRDESGNTDVTPSSPGVVDNGDGTYKVPIDISGNSALLEVIDEKHLLFGGNGYKVLKIFCQ